MNKNSDSDDAERDVTIEELLSCVKKTDSLLQGRLAGSVRKRNSNIKKPTKDEDNKNLNNIEENINLPNFGTKIGSINSDIYKRHLFLSSSKMTRSVSTPEINKIRISHTASKAKSTVSRRMDFAALHLEAGNEKITSFKQSCCSSSNIDIKENIFMSKKSQTTSLSSKKVMDDISRNSDGMSYLKSNLQHYGENFKPSNLTKRENTDNSSTFYLLRQKYKNILDRESQQSCSPQNFDFDSYNREENYKHISNKPIQEEPLLANEALMKNLDDKGNEKIKSNLFKRENINPDEKIKHITNLNKLQNHQLNNNVSPPETHCQDNIKKKTPPPVRTISLTHNNNVTNSPKQSLLLSNSDIISVSGQSYLKIRELGKGGSSIVYEVIDLASRVRKAIKIVDLKDDDDIIRESYRNEIKILERLQKYPRIIKIFNYEETKTELKIVMEAGNIDLAGILKEAKQKKILLSPISIKHYWQEMLLSVCDIHKEGIVHSDLKPANFLSVNSMLKLIDFGIATPIQNDMTSVLKDSQAGTYNYMSPESLNDIHSGPIINGKAKDKPVIKIGVKSDVWSLGCILYNLVYGHTPFQHIVNPLSKLAAISNPKTQIEFPTVSDENLLNVLKSCLQFDPKARPSIQELIIHPYLSSE